MHVQFEGFGRPLRNPLRVEQGSNAPISVGVLA
jgi:hypothetical protein